MAIISPIRLFLLFWRIQFYVQKRGYFEGMSKIKTDHPKRLGPLRTDPEWWNRALLFIILDLLSINISYGVALWVRYDFHYSAIPKEYLFQWIEYMPIHTICTIAVFTAAKLYHSLWKYASVSELLRIIIAQAISSLLCIWGNSLMGFRMPVTYYVVGGLLQAMLVALSRFAYRMMRYIKGMSKPPKQGKSVMVIGGGDAGRILIREIVASRHLQDRVRCVIDDDRRKIGRYIEGIPICGNREQILQFVDKYSIEKIIVAMPTAKPEERRDILQICQETGCEVQVLPGVYQLINGEVSLNQLRPVALEDLLGRKQIDVNLDEILNYVQNQVILVTGGGGSIGSELCRQLANHHPRRLIIFDIYENNAYEIQQELKMHYPSLDVEVLIGSVRDKKRLDMIFKTYQPDIIYHAAAHKHVPLMEDSPNEAIKNNVFGTLNVARAAGEHGARRFVMISTDKAVNPTNIMGASKRICEMIIQTLDKEYATEFVAVRFGNVLGSNGSVIPLFKKQIMEGGPVTVTHPDIIRYFMTISEAVSLVLQAGAYAKGGEIFILDMGKPVRIADMARNLIRLSGHEPDVDIRIEYTGLRPGEKLYEELLMNEEGMTNTENELIHIGKPIEMDVDLFWKQMGQLHEYCEANIDEIKAKVAEVVQTYKPQNGC